MRELRFLVLLGGLALAALSAHAVADAPKQSELDETRLKNAGLQTDGPSLLQFFKKRTLTEDDQEKVRKLIRNLGSRNFRVREDSSTELIARGPVALDLLKESLKDGDLEIVRRATCCIQRIVEKDVPSEVVAAAVRLLAERKPPAAVETLLAYLPAADNDTVADEMRNALTVLAVRDGKTDKALIAALSAKSPVRRGSAAVALTRAKVKEQREAVRQLLADPEPEVRLRVATALAYARDKDAVPVLINLLEQLPQPQGWQAEDILYRLAEGQSPPSVSLGSKSEERKKCRDAWTAWWAGHKDKVDLARLEQTPRLLGYTLLVLLDEGRVIEVDARQKVLWEVNGLKFPLDVQLLPDDRLLLAEYHLSRVTERNRKGEIVWQHTVYGPLVAQRLANGNTFIATDLQLEEIDLNRKVVFTFAPPVGERIMKAVKLENGEAVCLTDAARVLRVDAAGKVIGKFDVDVSQKLFGGRLHALNNGRVLIPHNAENKVVEYDRDGKVVWEVSVRDPIAATRLPNGNTLVTSMSDRKAIEYDRNGQVVWQYQATDSRVTRALRR